MQVDEPTKTERANYVELREVLQCTNLKKIQFWTQPWDSFINSPFFFFLAVRPFILFTEYQSKLVSQHSNSLQEYPHERESSQTFCKTLE